jgi:hypothetical protein
MKALVSTNSMMAERKGQEEEGKDFPLSPLLFLANADGVQRRQPNAAADDYGGNG